MPRICDYEGSRYRTDFWENRNRDYEDAVERIAMEKLLPPQGERIIEIGAGFGRLADLYQGYKQVFLTDYARTQLEEAQAYLGQKPRFTYVVADVYNLPFADNSFEALTMVRVMHHLTDVPAALAEIQRILAPKGTTVIEYASKFHLKSLLRWFAGRQTWSPFDQTPLEFVELNFNFHPAWMRQQFEAAGLSIKNSRTLSHYRVGLLKRLLPVSWLVTMDRLAQPSGNYWQLTPSVFLQAQKKEGVGQVANLPPSMTEQRAVDTFRCPRCKASGLTSLPEGEGVQALACRVCGAQWSFKGGIYDFKTPLYLRS